MLETEGYTQHPLYFGNNYKVVNRKVGCEVSRPMTDPQPTEKQLDSKLEKPDYEEAQLSISTNLFLDAINLSSDQAQEENQEAANPAEYCEGRQLGFVGLEKGLQKVHKGYVNVVNIVNKSSQSSQSSHRSSHWKNVERTTSTPEKMVLSQSSHYFRDFCLTEGIL